MDPTSFLVHSNSLATASVAAAAFVTSPLATAYRGFKQVRKGEV